MFENSEYIFLALRIHISLEMKKALDAIGGYKTEARGLVEVKVSNLMFLDFCSVLNYKHILFNILG